MANRVVAAVLIAAGSIVLGFGSVTPSAQAQPAQTPMPTDEEQIRDVLTRQSGASAALDLATTAQLICQPAPRGGIPTFGPDIESTLRGDQFSRSLAEQISGATRQLTKVMAATPVRLASIDDIVVTADTATADLTMTIDMPPNPPQTQITRANLLRQNGQWCIAV